MTIAGALLLAAGCAGGSAEAPAPRGTPPAVPPKILFSKAEGYFYKGLYREAIQGYTEVIAADPRHAGAYRCRAAAFAALRRDAEARSDYRRAIELAPRDDDAWLGRGLYRYSRGRYAEAVEDFDRAIELDPRNSVTHLYRARACEKIGRFREAEKSRHTYVHCTIQREAVVDGAERPPVRELKALGLE